MTPTKNTAPTKPEAKPEVAAKPEAKFQEFKSSRPSTRLTTPGGQGIAFLNYTFITSDEGVIKYLKDEIANGLRLISLGETLTTTEINPMARLKEQIIQEYKESEAQKAKDALAGKVKDMGSTDQSAKIKPMTTKEVAS